jgi:hypothetical protein
MEGDAEIQFISNSFYCEVRGFISDINYNNMFDELSDDIKNDLILETKRVYNIINEIQNDTINMSFFLDHVKEVSGIKIDIEIYYTKYIHNDTEHIKLGFNVYLRDTPNISMQCLTFYVSNVKNLTNHIYNLLFYVYVFVNNFSFDSLFNNFYHKDDIIILKEMRLRTLRLFGNLDSLDCCVCLEKSTTLTECNHILCNRCFSKLVPKICPLCRTILENDIDDEGYPVHFVVG